MHYLTLCDQKIDPGETYKGRAEGGGGAGGRGEERELTEPKDRG